MQAEREAAAAAVAAAEAEAALATQAVGSTPDSHDVFDRDAAERAADLAAIREREAARARRRAESDARDSKRPDATTQPAERIERPEFAPLEPIKQERPAKLATLVRSAKAATSEAVEQETGRRLPRRALLQVALGAFLVALVIVAAPRVSGVVAWGQDLFAKDAPTTVGTAVTVEASQLHPAAVVLAGAPATALPTAGKVAKGQHLVVVPVQLTNRGLVRWDVPIATRVHLVDTLGVSHPVAKTVTGVKGRQLLGAKLKLAPGKSVTGYVVFSVPDGRTIRSVELGLSDSVADMVTWKVGS